MSMCSVREKGNWPGLPAQRMEAALGMGSQSTLVGLFYCGCLCIAVTVYTKI